MIPSARTITAGSLEASDLGVKRMLAPRDAR
jgi:hypothetical protein